MEEKRRKKVSKYLSKLLRHDPARLGLALEPGGWLNLGDLLRAFERRGVSFSKAEIFEAALRGEKPRFSIEVIGTSATHSNDMFSSDHRFLSDLEQLQYINPDHLRIRANYGHSIPVDLDFSPECPPERLFHGTARQFLTRIMEEGLVSMRRQFVHLYEEPGGALEVGQRHGRPVLLAVRSGEMHGAGLSFYPAGGGIWLTEGVPSVYLRKT